MLPPDGFVYSRPVPREWQAELDTLTPKQDRTTWLHLAWMPGDPWSPVQRWCVYEMVPIALWGDIIKRHQQRGTVAEETMEWIILQDLQGPNPRSIGHYDSILGRFVSECLVTKQEWELYREFHAVPKLYWIIQGTKGGHKRRFTPIEQKYLKLAGLPADPPTPGDLPYAPYDRRVFDQLARRDRLQGCNGKVESEADFATFRRSLVGWLTDQVTEVLESQPIDLGGIPRTDDDPTGHIEQAVENFIQTGHT